MEILLFTVGLFALTAGLVVASYLDRVYRDLGRVTTGRVHDHLDTFESDIEPRFKLERPRAALAFTLLARLWLVVVATVTALGVVYFVPNLWQAALEVVLLLGLEVVIAMQLLPVLLLAGVSGNWLAPLVPVVRVFLGLLWPIRAIVDLNISVLHLSEEEPSEPASEQQALEALVDAATEEGIIEQDEARLIEQVIEFGDKRVRDVMTPRPDVIAIPASATLEELRDRVVETKFSRLPVYGKTLDDIVGIVVARDMLEVPDRDAARRTVSTLMRPALFVPETKFGSDLLKEMQRKNQQMAVVIDEYGLLAGVVTVEDLVEEIVGEIGEEDRHDAPLGHRGGSGDRVAPTRHGVAECSSLASLCGRQACSHPGRLIPGAFRELRSSRPRLRSHQRISGWRHRREGLERGRQRRAHGQRIQGR